MDAPPRNPDFTVPDFIEPSLCGPCSANQDKTHRPCFKVGCYCECSRVPAHIA